MRYNSYIEVGGVFDLAFRLYAELHPQPAKLLMGRFRRFCHGESHEAELFVEVGDRKIYLLPFQYMLDHDMMAGMFVEVLHTDARAVQFLPSCTMHDWQRYRHGLL